MDIQRIWNYPWKKPVIGGIVTFTGGLVAGFFIGQRKLSVDIEEERKKIQEEMDELIEMRKLNAVADMEEVRRQRAERREREAIAALDDEDPVKVVLQKAEQRLLRQPNDEGHAEALEPERRNIFAHSDEDWNYEEELKLRNPINPYVIHRDEFFSSETGFSQRTVTYYKGDDTLVDEEEVPIYDHSQVIGTELKFGHGSGDPIVVYIRNEKLRGEYEVLLEEGYFSEAVRGLKIEQESPVEHSAVRKFRQE